MKKYKGRIWLVAWMLLGVSYVAADPGDVTPTSEGATKAAVDALDARVDDTEADLLLRDAVPWADSRCVAAWHKDSVVLDTGKVSQWNDVTGNGHHLTQATAASRGVWTASGVEVVSSYSITNPITLNYQAFTVILIHRQHTDTLTYNLGQLFKITSSGPGLYFGEYNCFLNGLSAGGGNYTVPLVFSAGGAVSSYAITSSSARVTCYANGLPGDRKQVFTAGSGALAYFFGTDTGGSVSQPATVAALIYNAELSYPEIQRVIAYFGATNRQGGKVVIATGSSTVAGQGATNNQFAVIPQVALMTGAHEAHNGVNGQTFATVAANFTAAAGTIRKLPGAESIYLVFPASNDLSITTTGEAALLTNIQTHVTQLKTANPACKVILVGSGPRTASFSGGQDAAGYETDRQTVRTDSLANWASWGYDRYVDVAADTRIGTVASLSGANYAGDGIHLSDAGYAILAELIAIEVSEL